MMTAQYYQLVQNIDVILQKVNNIHVLKFGWNAGKKVLGSADVQDMNLLESIGKAFFDPFTESRQMFTQWIIQSDVFITNSNFQKDIFLKRFVKQRDKVQTEFDKTKVNSTKLTEKLGELRIHLDALQQHGKQIVVTKKLQKIEQPQLDSTIILEKGKTVDILKQVSEVFNSSTKFLKIMDNWIGVKTLEYLTSMPEIPVKILTSNIEKKSQVEFQVMLNRINETRSNPIEVRLCEPKEFHDRYTINGKDLWMIGASLKDVGYKNWTTISKINDKDQRKEINKIFDMLWKNSIPFSL